MKLNYDEMMTEEIEGLDGRRGLLLHACCGPCSLSVIERLLPYFSLTVYFYNPNIYPEEEYLRRKEELRDYLEVEGVPFIDGDYEVASFEEVVSGLEGEPEGGARCEQCFRLRLEETFRKGEALGFDYVTTTLTVSPHKNSQLINEIGSSLEGACRWLPSDFKKRGGYQRGAVLARELGMYRQTYCGCKYSIRKENN